MNTVFLTRRDTPLPGWRVAFPSAQVCHYNAPTDIGSVPVGSLIWLHIDNQVRHPAQLVETIRRVNPGASVVVLSNVPSETEGLAVLEGGAAGYCGALAVPDLLQQIGRVIEHGGLWIGPELMDRLLLGLGRNKREPQTDKRLDGLSPREREVALAVGMGASNKEIAQQLGITERTVKAHLAQVFSTLKLRDRLQLALFLNQPSRAS